MYQSIKAGSFVSAEKVLTETSVLIVASDILLQIR